MKMTHLVLTLALINGFAGAGVAIAAGDLTAQTPVEIKVELGSKENALRFFPDKIELGNGKLYKLVSAQSKRTGALFQLGRIVPRGVSRERPRSSARTGNDRGR